MNDDHSIAIVYASTHHGNTRKLAETLAAELEADLLTVEQAKTVSLKKYKLVGFGSGIYFGRHDRHLRQLVDSWTTAPSRVFLFSTAGLPFLGWLQHKSLRSRLIRKQSDVVAEFSCRGWDTVGPLWFIGGINRRHPNERDLERAKKFANRLKGITTTVCKTE